MSCLQSLRLATLLVSQYHCCVFSALNKLYIFKSKPEVICNTHLPSPLSAVACLALCFAASQTPSLGPLGHLHIRSSLLWSLVRPFLSWGEFKVQMSLGFVLEPASLGSFSGLISGLTGFIPVAESCLQFLLSGPSGSSGPRCLAQVQFPL